MRSSPRSIVTTLIFSAVLPLSLSAQVNQSTAARVAWTVTAMGGLLDFEFADNQSYAFFAARADRPMNEYMRFEFDVNYARVDVQTDEDGFFAPDLPEEKSNLIAATIGFQGRLPLGAVEPYGGVAAGLFWRKDATPDAINSGQTTAAFPMGVRAYFLGHWVFRVEARYRLDQAALGGAVDNNWEKTLGLGYVF